MIQLNRICIFGLLVFTRLQAQIDIDAISTDTIDLFSQQQPITDKKTATLPLWSSLLLPGSGHQSIGRSKSALGYISADVVSLFCALLFNRFSKNIIENSKAFASLNADISISSNSDLYWQVVGNYNSYLDYFKDMKLMRDSDNRFLNEQYSWLWEDESLRKKFVSMQKNAKQLNTISSFFIGALILNRIVAFIDLRSILKNNRYHDNTTNSFKPIFIGTTLNGLFLRSDF